MFTSTARLDFFKGVLRGMVSNDLILYYRALYYYASFKTILMWTPRYGAHITVYNKNFHGERTGAYRFNNRIVEFQYDPIEIYQGGQNRGFTGFYLPVYSAEIKAIQNSLGFDDAELNRSLHLSLFSDKHDQQLKV